MKASTFTSPAESPWGTYAPGGAANFLRALAANVPANWIGRRLALACRRVAWLGAAEIMDLESEGLRLRVSRRGNVSDRKFAFMPQFFDVVERREILSRAQVGGYFLDIGANAGIYSLCMARRYRELGLGEVFAFEPNPLALERLRQNLRLNELESTVECIPQALGERAGVIGFVVHGSNLGQSGLDNGQAGDRIEVPCGTLLDFLESRGLGAADALKIDVEGAEDRVLADFMCSAPAGLLPRLVVIENSECSWSVDLFGLFRNRGYERLYRGRMNSVFALGADPSRSA